MSNSPPGRGRSAETGQADNLPSDWRVSGVGKLGQQGFGFLADHIHCIGLRNPIAGQNAVSH